MTLSLYMIRRFLRAFAIVAGAFLLLLWFIELIETVRRHGAEGGLARAAGLAGLALPDRFYMILPLVVLLASITMLIGMARGSELVAIRASGRGALRMLIAPMLAALVLGGMAVAVLNPVVAVTAKRHASLSAGDDAMRAFSFGDGVLWLRQSMPLATDQNGDVTGQAVIRASYASPDATTLYDASFVLFDAEGNPVRRVDGPTAKLGQGEWLLHGAKSWSFDAANPEASATREAEISLPTDLTAEGIRDGFGDPAIVPIWQLPRFIAGLKSAGFSARRHAMHLQSELASPLLMVAMLLVAACFTMHHLRGRKTGIFVLAAFISGVGLFFLRYFAQVLGERGDIAITLAAWAPPLVAILCAIGWLLQSEDG